MATRSAIGFVTSDNKVHGIYCHYDGDPSYNGKVLKDHYTDPNKIIALLDEGDLSSLGAEIGEKHDFDSQSESVCTFYARDRGEIDVGCAFLKTEQEFITHFDGMGCEFFYLFREGNWYVTSDHANWTLL